MEGGRRPTADEVVALLKDDGDFDSLRLKIVRQIKENEKLRSSIIEEVKQSEILNKDGSEDLKPRQLSDEVYKELGKKLMGQISDEIWKVIRSDSMKADIRETVESVYDKLANPKAKEEVHPSPKQNGNEENGEGELAMPPGFAVPEKLPNSDGILLKVKEEPYSDQDWPASDLPPGFARGNSSTGGNARGFGAVLENGNVDVSSLVVIDDDDPELPPGFS